jgi:hypothetical protein
VIEETWPIKTLRAVPLLWRLLFVHAKDRFGLEFIADELLAVLEVLTVLSGREYGESVLAADVIIRNTKIRSFDSRVQELRARLLEQGTVFD